MSIIKRMACTFVLACVVVFGVGVNTSFAENDVVFDIAALDGSIIQTGILDASTLAYGTQPFTATSALVNGDAVEYNLSLIHI